jgi:hypothetical protein
MFADCELRHAPQRAGSYFYVVNKQPPEADESAGERRGGSDPYNRTIGAPGPDKEKRRSLDDMRRLSDYIKSASTWEEQRPERLAAGEQLFLQLAGLRVELERVLTEFDRLDVGDIDPGDLQAVTLRSQLRDAARSVEEAIIHLTPSEDEPER